MNNQKKRLYKSRDPDGSKVSEKLHTTRGDENRLKEKHVDLSTDRGTSVNDIPEKKKRHTSRLKLDDETVIKSTEGKIDQISDGFKENPKAKTTDLGKAKDTKKAQKRIYSFSEESAVKVNNRLRFEDGKKPKKTHLVTATVVSSTVHSAVHNKLSEHADENAAVEGALKTEESAENAYRVGKTVNTKLKNRSIKADKKSATRKLKDENKVMNEEFKSLWEKRLASDEKLKNSSRTNKYIQKQRLKKEYAKAAHDKQKVGKKAKGSIEKIKDTGGRIINFFVEHKKAFGIIAAILMLFLVLVSSISSCSAAFGTSVIDYAACSYISSDEAIRDADLYYSQLEAQLQEEINNMESDKPGYDIYRYNIGPIEHDPFVLISYLTAKYGEFTFSQVGNEVEKLFREQYNLTTEKTKETITQTKKVKVGESLGVVTTSGYCSCPICCGQWSGGPTASGVMPQAKHTIAVDANNPFVPMGTKVVMNGTEYTVEDTGAFDRFGVQFDVFYANHAEALAHGHKKWEAFVANDNGSQEVEVTTTEEVKVLNVTLQSKSLSAICQDRLHGDDKEYFKAFNEAKGNLQMFASPFTFRWYGRVTSQYGYRIHPITGVNQIHNGIDIAASEGTEVMAGMTGKVKESSYNDSYGNYIVLENQLGYEIRYAHLQTRNVITGEMVTLKDVIGTVGSTGDSTGPHLHLELLKNGERLNPIFYFEVGTESIFGGGEYCSEAAEKLLTEAEKHLGTPYVWGGYAPGGFDCSGFVSYCLTHSGVRNTGHLTAQGLYDICEPISESEMQPGDLVFFTGTYNAGVPVTHIGIYAGDGQMIHCGNPIQYTSIYSSYWQNHWYGAGRW